MVEEIDLCDQGPGEDEVRSRSLGLEFCCGRGQFRDSFASRTKMNSQSWNAGREQQVCCCTLVQPTLKVYWTRMPHQGGATQKIPLSAGYRNCRSTPPTSPWAARRASALAPSHCPPARCPSSFPVLSVSIPSHPRHPARPPLPAPLKLNGPSYRRAPHRAPGITDRIFLF